MARLFSSMAQSDLVPAVQVASTIPPDRGRIAVLVVFLIVIAAATFVLVSSLATTWRKPIWALVMIISWVPVQLAVTWFLRNRRDLELAARSRTES